jgi:hypothetical protein
MPTQPTTRPYPCWLCQGLGSLDTVTRGPLSAGVLSTQRGAQSILKLTFSGPRHVDRLVITEKEGLEVTPVAKAGYARRHHRPAAIIVPPPSSSRGHHRPAAIPSAQWHSAAPIGRPSSSDE